MPLLDQNLPPEAYGLLGAIAGPESGGRYDVLYGGGTIGDLSRHPRRAVPITTGPNAGQTSSAAGRYQFLAPTWDDISSRYDLTDFSPANQDAAAWALANETYSGKTGGDLTEALRQGKLQDVAQALSGQWTSLAGGIEPQAAGSGKGLLANYHAGMAGAQSAPVVASAGVSRETPMKPALPDETDPSSFDRPDYAGDIRGLLSFLAPPAQAESTQAPAAMNLEEAPVSKRVRGLAFKQLKMKPRRIA